MLDNPEGAGIVGTMTFQCDLCGACCCTFPVYVSAEDAEREPRIALKGRNWPSISKRPAGSTNCFRSRFRMRVFLGNDNRCNIYHTRPEVCRRFEAGSDQCQEARRHSGLGRLEPAS